MYNRNLKQKSRNFDKKLNLNEHPIKYLAKKNLLNNDKFYKTYNYYNLLKVGLEPTGGKIINPNLF